MTCGSRVGTVTRGDGFPEGNQRGGHHLFGNGRWGGGGDGQNESPIPALHGRVDVCAIW